VPCASALQQINVLRKWFGALGHRSPVEVLSAQVVRCTTGLVRCTKSLKPEVCRHCVTGPMHRRPAGVKSKLGFSSLIPFDYLLEHSYDLEKLI
jgi:hypothetical protein